MIGQLKYRHDDLSEVYHRPIKNNLENEDNRGCISMHVDDRTKFPESARPASRLFPLTEYA